ncbi:phage tail protein [Halobacteriales archaeon QS_8_69_26]|nr:MAG: phage tail protein [Halobacteriales archaeon QS_8_69_26]
MERTEFFGGEPEDDISKIQGLMVGQVAANSGKEDPETIGQVKVTFPFRDKDDESWWARVATEMASSDYGTWFLPEVGDEVVVGFENGDMRYPVVLGSLYTGNKKPPYNNENEENNHRAIKSRYGHLLDFHDKDGKEKITLKTGADTPRKLLMEDKDEKITLDDGTNTIVMDGKGGKIEIDADKEISLTSKKIKLEADQKVDISAKQEVNVSAKTKIEVSSKGQLKVKTSGMGKIESSGILQIKGSLVQIN